VSTGTSTQFNAQIQSYGDVHSVDNCTADEFIQFTGNGSQVPTTISGGPEGTISGSGTKLYFIEISGTAGVIDTNSGLAEPDGDAIQQQNAAGQVVADPASHSPGICTIGPTSFGLPTTFGFLLSGSITLHT
jgi:hypothetical protein